MVEASYLTVVGDLEARLLGVAEDGCYGFRGHRRHVGDVELEAGEAQDGRGIKSGIKQLGEGAMRDALALMIKVLKDQALIDMTFCHCV
jgi:hypothetical protein